MLVVSSDNLNEICIILYMTTHPRDTGGVRVQIESETCGTCAGSTVLCDQIRTVSQTRLEEDSYIGRVSEEELQAIEKGLLETLGIYEIVANPRTTPEAVKAVNKATEYICGEPLNSGTLEAANEVLNFIREERDFYKTQYERILNHVFTPKAIAKMKGETR